MRTHTHNGVVMVLENWLSGAGFLPGTHRFGWVIVSFDRGETINPLGAFVVDTPLLSDVGCYVANVIANLPKLMAHAHSFWGHW